jgi:hypothetical protein
MHRILEKYSNIHTIQNYFSIILLVGIIVLTSHFLACIWFLVGALNDDQGWVQMESQGHIAGAPRPGFNDTCMDKMDEIEESSFSRYVTSLYYIFRHVPGVLG